MNLRTKPSSDMTPGPTMSQYDPAPIGDLVEFCVLTDDKVVSVAVHRENFLRQALATILPTARDPHSGLKYYRLRNPVPIGDPYSFDDTPIVRACAVEGNKIPINPDRARVADLAPELSDPKVYLVVDSPVVPRKRTAEEAGLEWLRTAKIANMAPSSLDLSRYRSLQIDPSQRLFDDRTIAELKEASELPDDKVPPIPLLYQPFGDFIDEFLGTPSHKIIDATPLCLEKQVDDFAEKMTQIYVHEDARRDVALRCLNDIFGEAFGGHGTSSPISVGKYRTDGHVLGPNGMPIFLVELKNEVSCGHSMALPELAGYYFHLIHNIDENLLLSSRIPALGLTIVGPMITFYAITYVGRPHLTPLTFSLPCEWRALSGGARKQLHITFGAAFRLLRCITQGAHLTTEFPSPVKHILLAITELHSFDNFPALIKFNISQPIVATRGRYIYLATSLDGAKLVIKFTKSYSAALHDYCAREGRAPRLRGHMKLPGNIYGVAMDFVDDARPLNSEAGSPDDRKNWADRLTHLVKSFHAAGFVHGDLRCPNILVTRDNKVMLIDYNWGGSVGCVFYPRGHLNPQLTEGRGRPENSEEYLMITKEDDKRIMAATLREIGIGS